MSFFTELKRRNVFRVGAAYLVVAWLVIQVTDTVVPALHLPGWIVTAVVLFLIIGWPLALVVAWLFELTSEGVKRETEVDPAVSSSRRAGRKLDYLIIGALVLALGYFTYDKLLLDPQRDAALVENTRRDFDKQAATLADAQKSIAVLPFANMSADPEQEYFVDGLAEELLNLLAGVPELRVAARTSSFSFKDKSIDVRIIAEQLNVKHVLEGSVRKEGDTLRITAQLIEADSGYHLWSRQFDRRMEDVFAIQEEIAGAVVHALKISLLGEAAKVEEVNPEAYTLYLQGKHFYGRRTREGFSKAAQAYQAAIELEPEYALAWSALGQTYFDQAGHGYLDTHEGMALARAAIERAIALDDGLARPYTAMGWLLLYYDWDWVAADEAMQRALALEPGNTACIEGAAVFAAVLGRLDEAVNLQRRVVRGDPLNEATHFNLAAFLTGVGKLEEAAVVFRHVVELNPQFPGGRYALGLTFLLQDQPERALAEFEQETDPVHRDLGTVLALSTLGRTTEADQARAAAIEAHEEATTYLNVMANAWAGNSDEAFRWLDIAYERRDSFLAETLSNPILAKLESDPRWPVFLDKMGLPR
jgi:adenylate cyclase